jgi:hypothetical protein
VTVTIDADAGVVADSVGRVNGFEDGRVVSQTPGTRVETTNGQLVVRFSGVSGPVVAHVPDRGGRKGSIRVTTVVEERGRSPVTTTENVTTESDAAPSDPRKDERRRGDQGGPGSGGPGGSAGGGVGPGTGGEQPAAASSSEGRVDRSVGGFIPGKALPDIPSLSGVSRDRTAGDTSNGRDTPSGSDRSASNRADKGGGGTTDKGKP